VLDVATLPAWIFLHFGRFPGACPIPLVVPLCAVLALPVVYLLVFSLWHWRTRYAGKHRIAWPILFVVSAWPLFSTFPGSVFAFLVVTCLFSSLAGAIGAVLIQTSQRVRWRLLEEREKKEMEEGIQQAPATLRREVRRG
jgi:hypothetical protein